MQEPIEVSIARIQENIKSMQSSMELEATARRLAQEQDSASRRVMHETIHKVEVVVTGMDGRLRNLETEFSNTKPTIQEFITIKNNIQGAGKLGKILWAIGGFLLAAAAYVVGNWTSLHK